MWRAADGASGITLLFDGGKRREYHKGGRTSAYHAANSFQTAAAAGRRAGV